jgi:hypothetical protein
MNDDKFLLCEICIWAGASAEDDCPPRRNGEVPSTKCVGQLAGCRENPSKPRISSTVFHLFHFLPKMLQTRCWELALNPLSLPGCTVALHS